MWCFIDIQVKFMTIKALQTVLTAIRGISTDIPQAVETYAHAVLIASVHLCWQHILGCSYVQESV